MSKLKIIQSLIQELEFRGGRKENIERANALKDVLSENTRLQQENIMLENTKYMCNMCNTSGAACQYKIDNEQLDKLTHKLMIELSPTTHALDLQYQSKFKEIILNNLDKDNTKIRQLLKKCWEE